MTKLGDNNPPNEFEIIKGEIEDYYDEAILWIDGDPIATQGQADGIIKLMDMIKAAAKKAEEHRKYENTPFDEGKKAVQAKYAPLIAKTKDITGKAPMAIKACQDALTPWNVKLQAERDEKARVLREEAEKQQREAQEAMQAANLADREEAEKKLKKAQKMQAEAKKAEKNNVKGMRTIYDVHVVDPVVFLRHYWATRNADLVKYATGLAEQDVRAGTRKIPGCDITPRKVAK